jgi:hypothetical protein
MSKILYVVYADTYDDDWGIELQLFGVADNENDMKEMCEAVRKQGYQARVKEVLLNQYCKKFLGSYFK